jgi:hypothetical protein
MHSASALRFAEGEHARVLIDLRHEVKRLQERNRGKEEEQREEKRREEKGKRR